MNDEKELQIELYLTGAMTGPEKEAFEKRLAAKSDLVELLNTYRHIDLTMKNDYPLEKGRDELTLTLQQMGKKYFTSEAKVVSMPKRQNYLKALSIAAGFLLIFSVFLVVYNKPGSQKLADNYIVNNLATLSQTMDGAKDSLQQGIALYNDKEYKAALTIFEDLYTAHPENVDALQYAGITRLVSGDYDAALNNFTQLAAIKNLYSNPGMFLKAVTLLKRNHPGDKEQAKSDLEQVVKENLENTNEATEMLKHW